MHFSLARFVSPPLSYMPFDTAGIRLQNMQKLSVYTAQGLRHMSKGCKESLSVHTEKWTHEQLTSSSWGGIGAWGAQAD